MSQQAATGKLVVISTPIGNLGDLSPRASHALAAADVIACEDTRRTGRLLELAVAGQAGDGYVRPKLIASHAHNERDKAEYIVSLIQEGSVVALVSDAGTPAVSDPGQFVVEAVANAGLRIEVIPGASAILSALVASGLPTDRFTFEGFMPRKGADRKAILAEISERKMTSIIYELPNRTSASIDDLIEACGEERMVAICRELTKMHEEVVRGSLASVAAAIADRELIGEVVVVLEGSTIAPVEVTDETVLQALAVAKASGTTPKDSVTQVAKDLGVAKNRVYALSNVRR